MMNTMVRSTNLSVIFVTKFVLNNIYKMHLEKKMFYFKNLFADIEI
jgi:hypothetical protein